MGLTTKRPKLELTQEEIDILGQKSNSRTLPKARSATFKGIIVVL